MYVCREVRAGLRVAVLSHRRGSRCRSSRSEALTPTQVTQADGKQRRGDEQRAVQPAPIPRFPRLLSLRCSGQKGRFIDPGVACFGPQLMFDKRECHRPPTARVLVQLPQKRLLFGFVQFAVHTALECSFVENMSHGESSLGRDGESEDDEEGDEEDDDGATSEQANDEEEGTYDIRPPCSLGETG